MSSTPAIAEPPPPGRLTGGRLRRCWPPWLLLLLGLLIPGMAAAEPAPYEQALANWRAADSYAVTLKGQFTQVGYGEPEKLPFHFRLWYRRSDDQWAITSTLGQDILELQGSKRFCKIVLPGRGRQTVLPMTWDKLLAELPTKAPDLLRHLPQQLSQLSFFLPQLKPPEAWSWLSNPKPAQGEGAEQVITSQYYTRSRGLCAVLPGTDGQPWLSRFELNMTLQPEEDIPGALMGWQVQFSEWSFNPPDLATRLADGLRPDLTPVMSLAELVRPLPYPLLDPAQCWASYQRQAQPPLPAQAPAGWEKRRQLKRAMLSAEHDAYRQHAPPASLAKTDQGAHLLAMLAEYHLNQEFDLLQQTNHAHVELFRLLLALRNTPHAQDPLYRFLDEALLTSKAGQAEVLALLDIAEQAKLPPRWRLLVVWRTLNQIAKARTDANGDAQRELAPLIRPLLAAWLTSIKEPAWHPLVWSAAADYAMPLLFMGLEVETVIEDFEEDLDPWLRHMILGRLHLRRAFSRSILDDYQFNPNSSASPQAAVAIPIAKKHFTQADQLRPNLPDAQTQLFYTMLPDKVPPGPKLRSQLVTILSRELDYLPAIWAYASIAHRPAEQGSGTPSMKHYLSLELASLKRFDTVLPLLLCELDCLRAYLKVPDSPAAEPGSPQAVAALALEILDKLPAQDWLNQNQQANLPERRLVLLLRLRRYDDAAEFLRQQGRSSPDADKYPLSLSASATPTLDLLLNSGKHQAVGQELQALVKAGKGQEAQTRLDQWLALLPGTRRSEAASDQYYRQLLLAAGGVPAGTKQALELSRNRNDTTPKSAPNMATLASGTNASNTTGVTAILLAPLELQLNLAFAQLPEADGSYSFELNLYRHYPSYGLPTTGVITRSAQTCTLRFDRRAGA